jgi:hypothetical protein
VSFDVGLSPAFLAAHEARLSLTRDGVEMAVRDGIRDRPDGSSVPLVIASTTEAAQQPPLVVGSRSHAGVAPTRVDRAHC